MTLGLLSPLLPRGGANPPTTNLDLIMSPPPFPSASAPSCSFDCWKLCCLLFWLCVLAVSQGQGERGDPNSAALMQASCWSWPVAVAVGWRFFLARRKEQVFQWHRQPREVMGSPSLETRAEAQQAGDALGWFPALGRELD